MKIINKKNIIIILNILGIICLIYFLIPYLMHDNSIKPDSMLSSYTWDTCGFLLTIGFIPLLIANILAYKFIKLNNKFNILFFIPSLICLVVVMHYLIVATDWKEEVVEKPITSMKCELNSKIHVYSIYKENNEYSLGILEDDKIPLSEIDYTSVDTITNSIQNYYKKIGGMCP